MHVSGQMLLYIYQYMNDINVIKYSFIDNMDKELRYTMRFQYRSIPFAISKQSVTVSLHVHTWIKFIEGKLIASLLLYVKLKNKRSSGLDVARTLCYLHQIPAVE